MKQNDELDGLSAIATPEASGVSRRKMISALGIGGLSALASLGLAQPGINEAAAQFTQTGPTDLDILNFALNLEYLEAEFYSVALTGQRLADADVSGPGLGTVTGGAKVPLSNSNVIAAGNQLQLDELRHVRFLRAGITQYGGTPVGRPSIDLNALGFGFANQTEFLVLARIFEDVGVSAYTRAAPLISDPNLVGYAGRILAVEAYHAGNIRLQVIQAGIVPDAIDARDEPPIRRNPFPNDSNALAISRTVAQLIALVGPFFPEGLNGTIK